MAPELCRRLLRSHLQLDKKAPHVSDLLIHVGSDCLEVVPCVVNCRHSKTRVLLLLLRILRKQYPNRLAVCLPRCLLGLEHLLGAFSVLGVITNDRFDGSSCQLFLSHGLRDSLDLAGGKTQLFSAIHHVHLESFEIGCLREACARLTTSLEQLLCQLLFPEVLLQFVQQLHHRVHLLRAGGHLFTHDAKLHLRHIVLPHLIYPHQVGNRRRFSWTGFCLDRC
mmetsp:Transcript_29850/g.79403  ORF Transcript_29850/g.79403 Transcript_29850/m.79403 type:complete len:223 (-) Transcript_29850:381-1049(-)